MTLDFATPGGVRRCVKTDRVLRPGDHYYSLLREEGEGLTRVDFAADAWPGPPQDAFAWWESPSAESSPRSAMAPNDVLLRLFDQWNDDPAKSQARFVLTLLLVRRRIFRIEPTVTLGPDQTAPTLPLMRVYCPRRDETYDVPEETPDAQLASQIQQELSHLLAA